MEVLTNKIYEDTNHERSLAWLNVLSFQKLEKKILYTLFYCISYFKAKSKLYEIDTIRKHFSEIQMAINLYQ